MGGKAEDRVDDHGGGDVIVVGELLGAHWRGTPGPLGGGHVDPLVLCFSTTSEKLPNVGG